MYCPKCGDEINYKSKYCRKCGAKLPYNMEFKKEKISSPDESKSSNNTRILFLAVLGLIVIIVLFASSAFNVNSQSSSPGGVSSFDDFINNYLGSSGDSEVEYSYYPATGYDNSQDKGNASDVWGVIFGESQPSSGENLSL